MAEEERKCSSGSCGGGAGGSDRVGGSGGAWSASRSSKKQKQKKPPQRGLGVAQLERLRLEEQQKKDAASFHPSPPTFSYFCPSASLPNFRVVGEFNPSDSFFKHIPSAPNMDIAATSPVPPPSMRNYNDYDAEMRRRRRVTDHELDLGSKMNMPLESNLAMGGQGLMHRSGSDQPPLLVNASSSSALMSLQSYPLEPPSNQSHHHGSFAPFRPQGEKVPGGGVKRSYPFSLENPPAPYIPFKIHKVGNPILNRPEEQSSFSGIDNLREGPSRSSSMVESSSTDSVKENKVSGAECLRLAPPMDTPSWQNWNYSQHFAFSASRSYNPYPGFEFPQNQLGYPEGLVYRQASPGWTDQRPFQQPYYNFLPPTMPANSVENTHTNGRSKEITSEGIDLNLKL